MSNDIVVPLDGSALADGAVAHAAEIARRLYGSLHLIRVHRPIPTVAVEGAPYLADPRINQELEEVERAWLMGRATEVRNATGLNVTTQLAVGRPADEIVAAAAAREARLIVCTTHGAGGWAPHWIGSVTDGIVRHAPCPVLAMSEKAMLRSPTVRSMLVLLDGSELSAEILDEARWFADAFHARITLLRIVAPRWPGDAFGAVMGGFPDKFDVDGFATAAKRELDAVAADLRQQGFSVTCEVDVHESPPRAILGYIERTNPDVVALATHGRGITRLLVGSVADKVLRSGASPVLVYRPPKAVAMIPVPAHAEQLFRNAWVPV